MRLSKGAVGEAVAWPGEAPRGRYLPAVVAGLVAAAAGPRAGIWALTSWGVAPLGQAVKHLVNRPRPFPGRLDPRGGLPQSPSFPSTHVTKYVAVFGFATWLLWRRRSATAVPATITTAAMVGLIGPSRVETGDHRPSDVAAGYLLGLAYLAALVALASRDPGLEPGLARSHEPRGESPADPPAGSSGGADASTGHAAVAEARHLTTATRRRLDPAPTSGAPLPR